MCSIEGCAKGGRLLRGMCVMHYERVQKHGDPHYDYRNRAPGLPKPCSVEGCVNVVGLKGAKGMCPLHYKRVAKHGSIFLPVREVITCTVCGDPAQARKLCGMHYARWKKHGDPTFERSLAERLWARCVETETGCLEWQGHTLRRYGQIGVGTRQLKYTHRVAWELTHGPIPDGMMVCHRCDNPPCCNPDHLFLGEPIDNTTDMIAKGRGAWQNGVPGRRGRARSVSAYGGTP